ncbi:MAG: hypothetical protein D6722_27365 [Bacteroidetes bacterium]|nr:MAG: hypothetical protein D6722_27365 [Bacteroidota bacterium]
MKILIKQPVGLNEAGSSGLNQDFVYPLLNTTNPGERFFYVCDGEGSGGEVAAKQVALNLAKFFAGQAVQKGLTSQVLDEALRNAEEALSNYKAAHPDSKDMCTSLGLLHLGEEQITFAWVGEVMLYRYDYRAQRLVSVTEGVPFDAKARISGTEKPQRLHLKQIPADQIAASDYFFLATRGIGEHVDRNTLNTMLKPEENTKPEALVEEIRNLSQGFAQEDFSCYLIQVDRVEGMAAVPPPPVAGGDPATTPPPADEEEMAVAGGSPALWRNILFAALILATLAVVVLLWWSNSRQQPYQRYLAQGEALMANNQHTEAAAMFDSAYDAGATEHEREEAARLKGKALALGAVEGEEALTEPAETYLAEAERYFEAGDWAEALDAYDRAARAVPADSSAPIRIPENKLALAHLGLGDLSYDRDARDCEAVITNYKAAFRLLESPELNGQVEQYRYAQAQARVAECTRILAAAAEEAADTSAGEQLAESTQPAQPQPTRTRSLAPREEQSTTEPTPSQPDPRTSRLATPEGERTSLVENTLSAEQEAELIRRMDAGKRLFSKARTSESSYEYRVSAQNLQAAAPVLDGSGNYLLAYLYHTGLAGEKDAASALKYAQKAAVQGWPAGQYLYGHLLLLRQTARDTVTAIQTLKQARAANFLEAAERLDELGIR